MAETELRFQVLHTYEETRFKTDNGRVVGERLAHQVHRENGIEKGRKILYRAAHDGITVQGIFDTLTGETDLDAKGPDDATVVHIESLAVDRIGVDGFHSDEVTMRSLGRVAELGFVWAHYALNSA